MWSIEETRDKSLIRTYLEQDRPFTAYALGDLAPPLFAHCRWFAASRGQVPEALALLFTGLETPSLLSFGYPDGLAAILAQISLPEKAYCILPEEHLSTFEAYYIPRRLHHMQRMYVKRNGFQKRSHPSVEPIRLDATHLEDLEELYAQGDVYGFSAYQLTQGIFYGVWIDAALVAAAGTHIMAPEMGVAAVGNVFTHPDHRGQGLGTACTGAVTAALLDLDLDVILNVAADNKAATRIYEKLGYRIHRPFLEMLAISKGSKGPRPA
jgi:ribosomal protein S18 acetylase RimI-like enzyme